ncbi:hypothetical protein EDC94DRAFT_644372 [Helicostylum pulchrum]|nr:hypothetical protein EDC94DRAFT_644372 [Helicostylum pulchrum]
MAKSKSAAKVNKKPVVVNINPEFTLSHDDCLRRKIISVLSDLKVKDWTNLVLLVDNAINHETLQVSVESVMRHILSFFSEVTRSFSENVALSKYSESCKEYWSFPNNKAELGRLIRISLHLKREKSKEINNTTYNLRNKTSQQNTLAKAVKDYQSAKFAASTLLGSLGIQELSASSEASASTPISSTPISSTPISSTPISSSSISSSSISSSSISSSSISSSSILSPSLISPAFLPVPGPSISQTLPLVLEPSNVDNIFTCENESESIGRRIKEEAVKLHDDYIKGYDMSAESKFVMDMGLSSTLDLTNKLDNYQSYLFSEKEFECLYEYFYSKYKSRKELSTPVLVSEKWNMIVDLATKKGPFITLKYISKIQSLDSTSETLYAYLEIFKHVVNIFYEDSGIIDSIINGRLAVSEQDVYDIWFPIIKKLVLIRKITRMKKGETTSSFTSKRKQFRYSDQVRVKGFKIDVRLLLDYERKEIDLCSGEVAIDANDADKVTHDISKCIREAKEILDHHVEAGMGENAIGWTIQFAGLEARLMLVHLFKEGLYVAISQKEMTFPQSLGELKDFTDTLNSLEYLVACNESEAVELVGLFNQVTRVHSVSLNSDNGSSNNKYRIDLLTRPTYYAPPSGKRTESVIPPGLYTTPRLRLFTEKIIIGEKSPEVPELNRRGPEDLFGWCELTNGNWYNSVTGVTYEASPYQ